MSYLQISSKKRQCVFSERRNIPKNATKFEMKFDMSELWTNMQKFRDYARYLRIKFKIANYSSQQICTNKKIMKTIRNSILNLISTDETIDIEQANNISPMKLFNCTKQDIIKYYPAHISILLALQNAIKSRVNKYILIVINIRNI